MAKSIALAVQTRSSTTNCSMHPMQHFTSWAAKYALVDRSTPLVCVFVVETGDNEQPPEEAALCVRYFNQRSHPDDLLAGRLTYAVLGLGDSTLISPRTRAQPTRARDCNQVAQRLDARLCALGAVRCHACGMVDKRAGYEQSTLDWIFSLVDHTLYRDEKGRKATS